MYLVSYSIIFEVVEGKEDEMIRKCRIWNETDFTGDIKKILGNTQFLNSALVQKCNGSIYLLELHAPPQSSLRELILNKWSLYSAASPQELEYYLIIRNDVIAVQYIFESAIGLHSITPGDSQVYSQIRKSISKTSNLNIQKSLIRGIYRNLPLLLSETKRELRIFSGYTSLERIACNEIIYNITNTIIKVAIIGYGSCGRLIDKILSEEKKLIVDIYNRTPINLESDRFFVLSHLSPHDLSKYNCIILCINSNIDMFTFFMENFESSSSSINLNKNAIFVNFTNESVLSLNSEIGIKLIDIPVLSLLANKTRNERKNEFQKARELVIKYIKENQSKIVKVLEKS